MQNVAQPPEFVCEVRSESDRVIVRLAGELDLQVAADVAAVVQERIDAGVRPVIVDLRGLSFLDSAGAHMLVAARRSAERRKGAVSLIRAPRNVQRVLELTGTESLFTFVAAEGEA